MKRSRGYCVTGWPEKMEGMAEKLLKNLQADEKVNYAVFGHEVCGDTGRKHLQGFVYFENAVTGAGLHRRMGLEHGHYHAEAQRGTHAQASDYCKKEGKIAFVIGTIPDPEDRKESAWDYILQMIENGASDLEILKKYPAHFARCRSGIAAMRTELAFEKVNTYREVKVSYVWGATGSGKTRSVLEGLTAHPSEVYRVTDYKHPFDNYRGQRVILFEEFRSSLKVEQMLNYLDGYYCELPCRYANKVAEWDEIFICTNIPLEHQFTSVQRNHPETWAAFTRRIHDVAEVN